MSLRAERSNLARPGLASSRLLRRLRLLAMTSVSTASPSFPAPGGHELVFDVAGGGIGVTRCRVAPASAAARFEEQHVTGVDLDPDFLGLDRSRRLSFRIKRVAMRYAVLAAEDAAGAVADAVTGGVADRWLG